MRVIERIGFRIRYEVVFPGPQPAATHRIHFQFGFLPIIRCTSFGCLRCLGIRFSGFSHAPHDTSLFGHIIDGSKKPSHIIFALPIAMLGKE